MKITPILLALSMLCLAVPSCDYYGSAQKEAYSQFNANALNKKYEWFKDAHARLTSLQAQIGNKQQQIKDFKDSYADVPRNKWNRSDSESFAIREQELSGIIATFNNLAAEYNSEMSKFHTAFLNKGIMPAGSNLSREVIQYK